jgi:hypothetical protein
MAHPLNEKINRLEKRQSVKCNDTCKYWHFPHLDTACVLSSVYSVKKNEPCYEYVKGVTNEKKHNKPAKTSI